jgi:tetratricopeptide (TPR) repeat protein
MRVKSNSFTRTAAALLAVLALALPALAENNTMDIKCVDQSGKAISGIKVQLQHINTNKWKDKKSDANGVAAFNKLDDGVYRVLARKEGFAPAFYEFVKLQGAAQRSVNLAFEPGSPETKVYFEDQAVNQRAYDFLGQGVQALQAKKFEESEKLLFESLRINPSNPEALFNLAIAQVQQKKWDPASEAFKRCVDTIALVSELQKAQGQPGNMFEEMGQRAAGLLKILPAFKLRSEADEASSQKKFDVAIAKYQEALKVDDKDPDLYYNLALAQANAQQYDDALVAADKAVQLQPAEGQYRELKKKIAEIKENQILIRARGILEEGDKLYQGGDFAGALKKYEEARPMVPTEKQGPIWAQMGRAYAKQNQNDQAVAAFNKAIEVAPDQPDFRKALAQFYMNQKRYDEALNVYADPRTTRKASPDQAVFELGKTLSNQGNGEVAELAFERTLQLNPQHADAMFELGMMLYYAKKNDKRAAELLTKYTEIGKDAAKIDNAKTVLVVIKRRTK